MAAMKLIWQCMFSPRLYKIYDDRRPDTLYEAGHLEKWGDQVIHSLFVMWNVGLYTSPILATVLYRRGYFVFDGIITIAKFLTGIGLILAASYCLRGIGRANNHTYISFLNSLNSAKKELNKDTKKALAKYDFEFYAWPVEFKWSDIEGDETKHRLYVDRPSPRRTAMEWLFAMPCQAISYLVAHTFGLRLVYPGSISMLQYVMAPILLQGRIKLVNENQGERFKLWTRDGNQVDTMFVDRRNKHANGSTLVICSEGNAGFYEIGIMVTPLEAGYSVLGWNHPGFGGSTGMPYPDQELNAIDIVMQFAIHGLKFEPENILLFGWSIGGYPTSWAAMNYPDIKGVILDATFDDIMALAVLRMPSSLEPMVRKTIRDYINLNNYQQLSKYSGPVLLIRRTEDEVICTEEMKLSSNRGNNLLVKLLKYRYPKIYDDEGISLLHTWLAADVNQQTILWSKYDIDEDLCVSTLVSYISEHSNSYPSLVGEDFTPELKTQMVLFLAHKYMIDFRSTHCTPLPANMFRLPWELSSELEYVKV
ncbi:phosphatidylserine lipase ABHD16A [Periplaneta americana]|uniref:phosphatidylserine lipase ABHD16A n=1 Tax=Periplaneta americana TaxID=6978 RepID=UPI0037E81B31